LIIIKPLLKVNKKLSMNILSSDFDGDFRDNSPLKSLWWRPANLKVSHQCDDPIQSGDVVKRIFIGYFDALTGVTENSKDSFEKAILRNAPKAQHGIAHPLGLFPSSTKRFIF